MTIPDSPSAAPLPPHHSPSALPCTPSGAGPFHAVSNQHQTIFMSLICVWLLNNSAAVEKKNLENISGRNRAINEKHQKIDIK